MKVGDLVRYKMEDWMVGSDPGLGIVIGTDIGHYDHHIVCFFDARCTWSQCNSDELIEVSCG